MSNLSKQKREKLIKFLNELKIQHDDDSSMFLINEIENELKEKKYGLVWEEHSEKVDEMLEDNIPVFKEVPEKKIVTDKNKAFNFLLEGDNLHSLKLLEKTHKGSIDIIYIDPPYNTKNKEFIYDDTIIGSEDSYRHSKWLSFMNERLRIAWNLLSDKGIIFISIDDNEQAQLKLLCDEIFGEEHYIGPLHWKRKKQPSYLNCHIASVMEYVLIYAKNIEKAPKLSIEGTTDETTRVDNASNNKSERVIKSGIRVKLSDDINIIKAGIYTNKSMETEFLEDVYIEDGRTINEFRVIARFRDVQERIDLFCKEDVLFITRNYGFRRDKLEEELERKKAITDLILDWGDNQDATTELENIFGARVFSYPKPSKLIYNIIKSYDKSNAVILDFFAGSGTTAQAVMELNKEDDGERKFILCTNNENNIAEEITYERIKRIIEGYEYHGKEISILKKIKLTITNLKKMSDHFEAFEKIKEGNKNKYEKLSIKSQDGYLTLCGENSKYSKIDGIPHNLKYYRTTFIKKGDHKISYTDLALEFIKELIELKFHIEIDNYRYYILCSEDDIEKALNKIAFKGNLFIKTGVFLSRKELKILDDKKVSVINIPEYYFREELKEVGEI